MSLLHRADEHRNEKSVQRFNIGFCRTPGNKSKDLAARAPRLSLTLLLHGRQ